MIVNKPYTNKEYADLAVYCNQNGLVIEDKGEYLESVNPPEPTVEEKQSAVRAIRNQYLEDTDKYMIEDFPISEEDRGSYKLYRMYLRNYTQEPNWWEENPVSYEEWFHVVEFALAEE